MYSKQEISKQKQAFWTAFGRYMKPILSADGEEISWINYKTGDRHIQVKMEADSRQASITIVLQHSDTGLRELYYERFLTLKAMLEEAMEEDDWVWQASTIDEHGREISTIGLVLTDVNIFRFEDWPTIISFFKPRIIAFDSFWSMVKYQFRELF